MKKIKYKVYVVRFIRDSKEWYSNWIADSKETVFKSYCEDNGALPEGVTIISIDEICNHK